MRKRYPQTVTTLALVAFFGAAIGIAALWQPFAYIFAGCWVLAMIGIALHQDRKRKP